MRVAEYLRKAELCKKAAQECQCPQMKKVWKYNEYSLITMALRAKRGW